jgi:hypothetical protein
LQPVAHQGGLWSAIRTEIEDKIMYEATEFTFVEDPGHGWLGVPMENLIELGVAEKISPCSYRNREIAWLEEDCDAGIFIDAWEASGRDFKLKHRYEENTQIRNMRSYYPY